MQLLTLREEKWNQQPYMKTTVRVLINDILKIYLQSPCQGELWSNCFTRLGLDESLHGEEK